MRCPVLRITASALVVGLALAGAARSDVPVNASLSPARPVGGCGNMYFSWVTQPALQIVTFHEGVTDPAEAARSLAAKHDLKIRHVYYRAIKGFSAVIPHETLQALRQDPRVKSIQRSELVKTAQYARLVPALNPGYRPVLGRFGTINRPAVLQRPDGRVPQSLPAPGAESRLPGSEPLAAVDEEPVTSLAVAVLDTGIQADHPELNVDLNRSRSFVPGVSRPNDGRGHGTYIAGLIGALGKSGVRGQAPGASLWAIKVLDDEGTGMDADVIKGLDYLIFNARRVAVANLSLEGRRSPALDAAASAATAAGIVVVVAAGNGGVNSREISPAREPRVLAVASTDDGSGAQGPLGFAKFSNFGDHVALVASGVNVRSTWKGSGYRELSGTSVSAALASGAAMRLILVNGRDLGRDGRLDLRDVELTKLKLVQGAAAPDEGAACGGESGIVEGPDGRLYPVLAKLGL